MKEKFCKAIFIAVSICVFCSELNVESLQAAKIDVEQKEIEEFDLYKEGDDKEKKEEDIGIDIEKTLEQENEEALKEQKETDSEILIEGSENSWRYNSGNRIIQNPHLNYSESFIPWTKQNGYYVNNKGEMIEGAIAKGIDVSAWQGLIDWKKVKNSDVNYAIIRCGYGMDLEKQDDEYWKRNADECRRLGIPFGVYLYSYADSVERAISEAKHVLRLVEGYHITYPIYYDLEENSVRNNVSKEEIAVIAKAFCDIISDAGYRVGIYSNTEWFTNYLTDPYFLQIEKWVAQYYDRCTYQGQYSMWQCTDVGQVDGIEGFVDLNMDFGTSDIYDEPIVIKRGKEYFGYQNNKQLFGIHKIGGNWYYFEKEKGGAAKTGWRKTPQNTYYYAEDGKLVRGTKKIDGAWYYFQSSGAMQTGWRKTPKNTYYYAEDGKLVRGTKKIDGAWYYFQSSGAMYKGWREEEGYTYFYDDKGHLVNGAKPESAWMSKLKVANDCTQLVMVSVYDNTYANISMHTKYGNIWEENFSTSGRVGAKGVGKQREGDKKTPTGVYGLHTPFGIKSNPGCSIDYIQINENHYWSGKPEKYYNKLVDVSVNTDYQIGGGEHLIDYGEVYNYCVAIDYNPECIVGKGSAIFLHCKGKGATGGCVSIPEYDMITVLKNLRKDAKIVIDYSENILSY